MSTPPEGVPKGSDDPDPTGMRVVLSSLAEPGPMPEDLATRICASLEREQILRTQHQGLQGSRAHDHGSLGTESTPDGDQDPAWHGATPVRDLAAERTRRKPQQWILAAAAVLAVGVIGTVVFDQVLSSAAGASDTKGNGGGESVADTEHDVDAQPDRADQVVNSVDNDVFASGAKSLLQVADGQSAAQVAPVPEALSLPLTDVKPLATTELNNCVAAAGGEPSQGAWVGTSAAIDGQQLVVVGDLEAQDPHAWAIDDRCPGDAEAEVLMGPVPLP